MTTYIMKCGCTLVEEELILKDHKKRCPNHPKQGIETIIKKCLDCPEILHLTPRQSTALRCPECARKIGNMRCREYRRSKGIPKRNLKNSKIKITKMDLSLYTQGLSKYLPEKEKKRA